MESEEHLLRETERLKRDLAEAHAAQMEELKTTLDGQRWEAVCALNKEHEGRLVSKHKRERIGGWFCCAGAAQIEWLALW